MKSARIQRVAVSGTKSQFIRLMCCGGGRDMVSKAYSSHCEARHFKEHRWTHSGGQDNASVGKGLVFRNHYRTSNGSAFGIKHAVSSFSLERKASFCFLPKLLEQ